MSRDKDLLGHVLCLQFNDVVILEENNRLDINDSDMVEFDGFLNRLLDGNNDESD